MVLGHRRMATAVASCLLALTATGCGQDEKDRTRAAAPSVTPAAPDGNGPLVPDDLELDAATRVFGADVSWPQCPKGRGIPQRKAHGAPMPTRAARFVVIGLTNGPSFTPNPCLADQVAWARERQLLVAAYAVTSYPTKANLARYRDDGPYDGSAEYDSLRNVGHAAAGFNVANLRAAGLPTPVVWVDVEPLTRPFAWSKDRLANRAVVQGTVRGYRDAGFKVGLYSTKLLWHRIVGGFRTGLPEWRAAGVSSQAEAARRCSAGWSFQGGTAVLGQWVEANRDRNLTCPGAVTDLEDWFGSF